MNEASIKQVLREFGLYNASLCIVENDWLMHPCPFAETRHSRGRDTNPSFGIKIDDFNQSGYNCFTCKAKGQLFNLKDKVERSLGNTQGDMRSIIYALEVEDQSIGNIELKQPIRMDYLESNRPQPIDENVYAGFYGEINDYPEAVEYLTNRGITGETAKKLGLVFDADEFENRIVFPIIGRDQKLYGYTGRTIYSDWKERKTKKGKKYPKIKNYSGVGKEWFLLGEHLVQDKKPILVVEGLFGYAHLVNIGATDFFHIVALMGSQLSKAQARTLISLNMPVYLMLDNDEAGNIGIFGTGKKSKVEEATAINQLYNYVPLYIPEWPEGKADPDELTMEEIKDLYNTDIFCL